ncbi:rhodanese-like domain-containing protein [Nocardioides speluncae]|uniref:rhodanese-like domain-containing protein n=1 Tax=Nocardioides speluncae TaxID=2670337 RepID=UPI000D68C314|nr:rhodanese-like domain-containing protein [Nocardioides speluncae]
MSQTIGRDDVKAMIDAGEAIVIEALPASYYEDAHLPGAINIPHDEVEELAPQLLTDKQATLIVYCADLACPNSTLAARRLARLGYGRVFDYAEGKADWIGAGLPTESSVKA